MSSIIEGYNYDIFISYRQKDNKHDGWVTEFVKQLKGELEATFKEDISIYFDENPSDGLLETHSVDKSLESKLRCLIFIPIISRTYCDPKSFAWQHEFCAFNKLTREDGFGMDVRLNSGNVASRILPVKIHDLDPEDKNLLENELGGVLRGIEFIYKEVGVDRPLTSKDNEEKNLNKTNYRNQINKVALAIKEILSAIKHQELKPELHATEVSESSVIPGKYNRIKILTISLLALVLIIVGVLLISKLFKPSEQLEKSIAVLPFINESPVDSNKHFINGVMEEILNSLQEIKDFRVLSRTSTDQYKSPDRPTIPEIARKLDVNYIVEGSGQKYGNTFILRVQLIKAKGKEAHIWANSYKQEIKEVRDYIEIPSQIAQSIAAELKAVISPQEKQLIENIPTTNLTAYDFYQRGREEYMKYWRNNNDKESLKKAEYIYHKALEYDSTFALTYTGLARVYYSKYYHETYYSEKFLDSVLILCDLALSYDKKIAEAYTIRGNYYTAKGISDKAIDEYDKTLKINPNYWEAYLGKGNVYWNNDLLATIDNYQKAASLNRGSELPYLLKIISRAYIFAGFSEKTNYYALEALKLDGDSVSYLYRLFISEYWHGNFKKSVELGKKAFAKDSTNIDILFYLGCNYTALGQYEESLRYFKKAISISETSPEKSIQSGSEHRIGYAYWKNGYKKEADYYINKALENSYMQVKLGRSISQTLLSYYDIAADYAFLGQKDKAYENLKIFNQKQIMPLWAATLIKIDPLFDNIRNESEFQLIAREIEAKYQAEHDRVQKWLEENKML